MLKRITVWSLVVGIVILGGVLGRKAYRRAIRAQDSSTVHQGVDVDPTRTETFLLRNVQSVHVKPVAVAGDSKKEWTQFLGAGGRGHSLCRPPLEWTEEKNVAWKIEVPGEGHSSPLIKDGRIWLTCSDKGGHSLRVVCLASASGAVVHDIEVFHPVKPLDAGRENSHATPTPILDQDRVYAHFPSAGTACLSATSGEILWKNAEVRADGPGGASPILCGPRLIIGVDGNAEQYLAALDALTGKLAWKTPRTRPAKGSDILRAYSTPVIVEVDGKIQIVNSAVDRTCGYDPSTGAELWHVDFRGHCPIPRPAIGDGLVFVATGYDVPQLWAIHLGGVGDITKSHVQWKFKRQVPYISSPLIVGQELYMVSDKGVVSCLDAQTGAVHWTERLEGGFSASPLCVGGNLYFFNDAGKTFVLKPGLSFELLHTNNLARGCTATPAVGDDAFFVRTPTHLYRIDAKNAR
jgi:outer membrane protein assembly factor BamB